MNQVVPNTSSDYGRYKRSPGRSWSKEEDNKLREAIELLGTDSWARVAHYVGFGRTRGQCSQRWIRGLDPSISRERWTAEEEQKLEALVKQHGMKSWMKIAKEIGTRNDVQCRYHYSQMTKHRSLNQLKQNENRQPFRYNKAEEVPQVQQPRFEQRPQLLQKSGENVESVSESISGVFDSFQANFFDIKDENPFDVY